MNFKKSIFMLKKLLIDIKQNDLPFAISDDLHNQKLGKYYFDFEENPDKLNKLINKFDENGIPVNKTYIDVTDKEYVYFPISIGQMGLAVFHSYLKTNLEKDKKRFLKFVDWFYENAEITEELGARWMTDVALPQYQNSEPWQSAFSQGRGISILLRGYQLTGEKKYIELAEKALVSFEKPVEEGGVTAFTKWGPFYEEYTSKEPTLVLNGMIFALCGIYDFVRVFPENKKAETIFNEGISTVKNMLPEFDLGYWSRYNLCSAEWSPEVDPATVGYQLLHIVQLEMLFKLTGEEIFKTYAEKFRQQKNFFNIFKMYFVKFKALKKIGRL